MVSEKLVNSLSGTHFVWLFKGDPGCKKKVSRLRCRSRKDWGKTWSEFTQKACRLKATCGGRRGAGRRAPGWSVRGRGVGDYLRRESSRAKLGGKGRRRRSCGTESRLGRPDLRERGCEKISLRSSDRGSISVRERGGKSPKWVLLLGIAIGAL